MFVILRFYLLCECRIEHSFNAKVFYLEFLYPVVQLDFAFHYIPFSPTFSFLIIYCILFRYYFLFAAPFL